VLCIKIKSEELGSQLGGFKLNAEVLSLLAPNLTKVVPKDAPLMIVIQPTQPPDSSFGTGKKVGGKTDSTIKLRIPDFGVSFYTMAHDRYVRIFKMIMDVNLGVSLVVSPQNELEVAVDADAIELKNARATAAYLVKISDPNSLLKLIVNLLTQTLGSNGLSIPVDISPQLSKALGVPISIKINGVGKDGAAGDWLSLKMTMSDKASPLLPTPRTIASLHKPAGLYRVENSRIIPTGEVLVDVPEFLGPYELEYQYRIGVGPWSTFHEATNGVLRVRSHILKVLGKHKIYIRGRIKGEYRTREEQPAVVEVLFDPVAPKASVKPHGDHLQIVAHDGVTPMQQLRYSYQLNGKWVAANGSRITLPASLKDAESVALRVRDNAGNTRIIHWSPAQQRVLGSQSTINGPHQRSTAFGCTTSPTPADGSLWLALILLLGLGTIRRSI
jgi:MYXO-CTERM domain-containing protein